MEKKISIYRKQPEKDLGEEVPRRKGLNMILPPKLIPVGLARLLETAGVHTLILPITFACKPVHYAISRAVRSANVMRIDTKDSREAKDRVIAIGPLGLEALAIGNKMPLSFPRMCPGDDIRVVIHVDEPGAYESYFYFLELSQRL